MARRVRGMKARVAEWQDFSSDLGIVAPADLIAAAEAAGRFAWDIETTGLSPRSDRLTGIAFYIPSSSRYPRIRAWYPFVPYTFMCHLKVGDIPGYYERFELLGIDVGAIKEQMADLNFDPTDSPNELLLVDLRPEMDQETTMNALRPIWEELTETVSIAHHSKFDSAFLRHAPGTERPIEINNILGDSMLVDFCANERHKRYGLKYRVKQEFGHQMTTFAEAIRGQSLLSFCHAKPLGVYAMDDCYWCYRLHERGLGNIRKQTPVPNGRDKPKWTVEKQLDRPMGKLERIYWGIDTKISRILMEMENAGVLIDWRWLVQVEERLRAEKKEITERIEQYLGWPLNPNSGPQVADALFASPPDGLGLPQGGIPIGKKGDPSTADKVIKHFARFHPLVADILKWRSLDTVLTSFVVKLIKLAQASPTGRVHSGFNQTNTVIARLSSSRPLNFQNQPRDKNLVRKAYCAHREDAGDDEDILLLGGDYGQIELRVAAHLAREENMIEVYQMGGVCTAVSGEACDRYKVWVCESCDHKWTPKLWTSPNKTLPCPDCGKKEKTEHQARCRHVDLHQRTADDAKVPRNPLAKNLNFGLLYRMGGPKFCVYADLFDADGMPRVAYAREVIERWHAAYPMVAVFHEKTEWELERNDWIAQTIFGRRRRLDEEKRFNHFRAVTQGIQFQVSGTAQDIMKAGMIRVIEEREKRKAAAQPAERKLWNKFRMLLQIHDEIVMEVPRALKAEATALVKNAMESVGKGHLRVPLTFDVKCGRTWDDIH